MSKLDDAIARLNARNFNWPIPWEVVETMARKENCFLVAYLCPAGVWTCGWGETEGVTASTRWTVDQADQRFFDSVSKFAAKVEALCGDAPTTPNQLGAMTSLAYNIGLAGFSTSSVLKAHKRGESAAAARAFSLWNKMRVGGKGPLVEARGLTARRAMEAALYLKPEDEAPAELTSQAVADESKLTASPISQAGAATAVTGVAATLASVNDQASTVQTLTSTLAGIATSIGVQPGVLLGAVLVGAGAVTLYWRYQQRKGGWA